MDRDDITGRLGEIGCPALIVHGSDDTAIPLARAEQMRDGLAGPVTFTLIDGAPHASNVTHPSAVNAEIVNFLPPEVLAKPLRDGSPDEVRVLAGLLARLDLRPVDMATAELAAALASRYRLRAADATHLATAVGIGANRFITNNQAIGLVAADVAVTAPIAASADWAADAHRSSLVGTDDDEPEEVLSPMTQPLRAAGWEEISSNASDLGDTEVLLSRRGQVLTAAYRPLTREVMLSDGRPELDMLCQVLADEGVLVEGPDGISRVDRAAATAANWSDQLLTVIEKHLLGGLAENRALAKSIHILLAGIWPWGTGVPHSDSDWDLLHRQIMVHLRRTALL
jgi:predicted nucleic acid-binding protein